MKRGPTEPKGFQASVEIVSGLRFRHSVGRLGWRWAVIAEGRLIFLAVVDDRSQRAASRRGRGLRSGNEFEWSMLIVRRNWRWKSNGEDERGKKREADTSPP
jgi:hypothetical protein